MKRLLTRHNFTISILFSLICAGLVFWISNTIQLLGSGSEVDTIHGMQAYQQIVFALIPIVLLGLSLFFLSLRDGQSGAALLYILGLGAIVDSFTFPLITSVILSCVFLVMGLRYFKPKFFQESVLVSLKFKKLTTASYYLHFVPLFSLLFCVLFFATAEGFISNVNIAPDSPLLIIPFLSAPISLILLPLHLGYLIYARYKYKDYFKSTNWALLFLTFVSLIVSVTVVLGLAAASMF